MEEEVEGEGAEVGKCCEEAPVLEGRGLVVSWGWGLGRGGGG